LPPFSRIHKLPPASCAVYDDGKLSVRRYWRCVFPPEPDSRSDDQLAAELWERVRHAVDIRLMSDVPLGVFLSGGLDSSAIAAHMVDLRREMGGDRVKSFSVGYLVEDGLSELDQASRVARALGTDHAEVVVTAKD